MSHKEKKQKTNEAASNPADETAGGGSASNRAGQHAESNPSGGTSAPGSGGGAGGGAGGGGAGGEAGDAPFGVVVGDGGGRLSTDLKDCPAFDSPAAPWKPWMASKKPADDIDHVYDDMDGEVALTRFYASEPHEYAKDNDGTETMTLNLNDDAHALKITHEKLYSTFEDEDKKEKVEKVVVIGEAGSNQWLTYFEGHNLLSTESKSKPASRHLFKLENDGCVVESCELVLIDFGYYSPIPLNYLYPKPPFAFTLFDLKMSQLVSWHDNHAYFTQWQSKFGNLSLKCENTF